MLVITAHDTEASDGQHGPSRTSVSGSEPFCGHGHPAARRNVACCEVGVGLVDGKIWSSGTESRVRTRYLRRDQRSTLFVFDTQRESTAWRWLAIESTVTLITGADAPVLSLRLFRVFQQQMPAAPRPGHVIWYGQEKTEEEFARAMVEEQRLIYEVEPLRTYGMY